MRRKSPSLLNDVLIAADLILRHTAERTLADYQRDPWFRSAVERNFEVIGVALRLLERRDPEVAAMIPDYREIIDFRNRIAHGYSTLDHVRVWRYSQENLPAPRDTVAGLLDSLGETAETELP